MSGLWIQESWFKRWWLLWLWPLILKLISSYHNPWHHTFFIQILSSNKRWPWWKCLYNILKLFPHWFVFFIILSNTFISNLSSSISWTWPYGILRSSRTPQFIPNNPLHHFTHYHHYSSIIHRPLFRNTLLPHHDYFQRLHMWLLGHQEGFDVNDVDILLICHWGHESILKNLHHFN